MNSVQLLGNVGGDPQLKTLPSGSSVCNFSLATSKKGKDGQDFTQWHSCVAFGKAGEIIAEYVKKGDRFCVTGEIRYRKWQNEETGETKFFTDIAVFGFTFCERKKETTPTVGDDAPF